MSGAFASTPEPVRAVPEPSLLDDADVTVVHFFEDAGAWWVVATGPPQQFGDRGSAFATARDLARQVLPSQLVPDAPDGWGTPASSDRERQGEPSVMTAASVVDDVPVGWQRLAGPEALGRSVLVAPGATVPPPWQGCEVVRVTTAVLADPDFLADARAAFLARARTVYVVEEDCHAPPPGVSAADVWSTSVDHDFVAEAAWSLLEGNAVDARAVSPRWPWSQAARALGASASEVADVRLPDGRPAWCDGGALRLFTPRDLGDDAVVVPREALTCGSLEPISLQPLDVPLAADQLAAVADPDVRARIIAPAGSGKTRVLTERARHLLASSAPADALTLVAFNKRAQLEMVERTRDLRGLRVRTLNALALSILNGTDGFAHRGARLVTIEEVQVRDVLASLVRFPRRANTDPAAPWLEALSRIRLGLRSPRSVEAEFDGDTDALVEVFPRYREALGARGVVDYDEQIYRCLEVLLTEPDVRLEAQRHCQLLLVDEFQDLTPAHMLLLRLLAGPPLGIFGVGDDDQTIYGYSGASPRWLVDFDAFVPGATHHALTVNYRCPAPVVTAATNLLSRNRLRVPKSIGVGQGNARSEASLRTTSAEFPEVATTELVRERLAGGATPSQIAVLTRVNSLLTPIQASLLEAGIPVQLRDAAGFLSRTGVAAALSWFRLALAPRRLARADLAMAARRPSRGLSPRVVEWIGEQSDVDGIERLAGRISDERSATKVASFATDLRRIAEFAPSASAATLLEFARSEIGLESSVQTLDEAHVGRNRPAHSDDLRALLALGRLHPDTSSFSSWLAATLGTADAPDGVTLATVHRVKGLEWPHVIVHDATAGLFPHRLSTDVEEERRVFHVAITRARDTLAIVADRASPSIFLAELTEAADDEQEVPRTAPSGPEGLEAAVGLDFRWGGYACTVLEVEQRHVVVAVGGSRLTVPFGSEVVVDGRRRRLEASRTRPARRDESTPSANPATFEALKSWRRERAARDHVPAYVVASDKTLEQIAATMPSDEAALLDVHGIGAAKVELYGDELLGILDAQRSAG